ncbi:hypothetical protein ACFPFV_00185 [Salinicoccus siamensis]|uniref:hypothetical protein n=1 Tax=Salinicoccus siamensis TaxID=381830 RepID=UPI003611EE1A
MGFVVIHFPDLLVHNASEHIIRHINDFLRERKLWFRLINLPLPGFLKRSAFSMNSEGSACLNL